MKEKIILWGTGQISEVVEYYIKQEKAFEICGYAMDKEFIKNNIHNNKPLIPFEDINKHFPPNEYKLLIAIGYKNINKLREQKFIEAKKKGYSCVSFISKQADCTNVKYGENVIILPYNTIQPYSTIGDNTFIWTGSIIGHHTTVGSNVFLTGCTICGSSYIKDNTFIGAGAIIGDNITIGKHSIIGIGSIVYKNLQDNSVIISKQTSKLDVSSLDCDII